MLRWLPDDPRAQLRRDRYLRWFLILVAVVLVAKASRKSQGVLVRNQAFGERFLEHEDPYFDPVRGRRLHGPYPPSLVLVVAPLASLPTKPARVVWAATQILCLVGLHRLFRQWLADRRPELRPHALALELLALLLVSRYLLRDMSGGGGNLLYLGLAAAGFELARRRREWVAGAFLGLGLVLKPNLAPLLIALPMLGRAKTLGSTLLAAAVLFWIPALHYGFGNWWELSERWGRDVVAYAQLDDLRDEAAIPEGMPRPQEAMNQSLREAVHRFLRPPGDSGSADVRIATTSAGTAAWIARLGGLALLGLGLLSVHRARGPDARRLAVLGLLPICLLLSPITWKAHHAALLPLFHHLVAMGAGRPRPRGLVGFLFAYWVFCDLLSEEIVGKSAKNALQAISLVTWWDVALVIVVAALVRWESRRYIAGAPPMPTP